eukprot:CAMPEP_0184666976 /NCGR_PEP_ID=MMETSP0308-20130426/64863_1 /TAXON_ID=38269 /ORGANISM="Gloeochaete witrockiana, Strain SAG 46.84" /LENGTH=118 /DNA_ID=CAMNT_0027111903 /DNA_START=192 /DNA_END=544 /DNA_ORIENTATION=-
MTGRLEGVGFNVGSREERRPVKVGVFKDRLGDGWLFKDGEVILRFVKDFARDAVAVVFLDKEGEDANLDMEAERVGACFVRVEEALCFEREGVSGSFDREGVSLFEADCEGAGFVRVG